MRLKIREGSWAVVASILFLLTVGPVQAATDQITTTPQDGVTITTAVVRHRVEER